MMRHTYTEKNKQWDRFSSIRSRPRRYIDQNLDEYYFPISRQPICVHPIISTLGEEALRFILIQSAYKFMYEIAMLETEMVNSAACKVANNRLAFQFPDSVRHDALTVIIDEAYHAFVAIDYMKQIEQKTGIKPIQMPVESPNSTAIQLVSSHLPASLHDSFELIAVCISEHTLTKELINIGKEGKLLKSFSDVMADHVLDEGRHAMIFSDILGMFWGSFNEEEKQSISNVLPLFIKEYLNPNQQIEFDREILRALNLTPTQVEEIISETHMEYDEAELKNTNAVIPNIIKLLERTELLSFTPLKNAFIAENLI